MAVDYTTGVVSKAQINDRLNVEIDNTNRASWRKQIGQRINDRVEIRLFQLVTVLQSTY